MAPVFYSKKFWVSTAGALAALVMAILEALGVPIPPDLNKAILAFIAAIVGTFNVGQGLADGMSGGKTSGYAVHARTVAPVKE